METVLETMGVVEASEFKFALRAEFLDKCISWFFLKDGKRKVQSFIHFLKKLDEFGFPPLEIFDGSSDMVLLQKKCQRILKCGEVEKLIELVEVFSCHYFSFPLYI